MKAHQAWIVSVNMGYGHQRAAQPFCDLACQQEIVIANDYPGIPKADARVWKQSRQFYEIVSRAKHLPLIGDAIFAGFDYFQRINPFYPRRDLSAKTFQLRQMYRMMKKNNWGKDLIDRLNRQHPGIPLLTTFFVPAFFAEVHGYHGDIYCLATDTDISRTWAPLEPHKTRIKYFAPTRRAQERLVEYGVPRGNIVLTGFPLPKDNVGGFGMKILKKDVWSRLINLDPTKTFIRKYRASLEHYLGPAPKNGSHPLTLTFAVGGAGAQRELGADITYGLRKKIASGQLRLILVAGVRQEVYDHFHRGLRRARLESHLGRGVEIIFDPEKAKYFTKFNQALRTTDILWTKPSELAFFSGLGLPIIIAEPIGSQEKYNKAWLESLGAGISADDVDYVDQWLFDWLESGWLAEAAFQGFVDAPKFGTYKIEQILFHEKPHVEGHVELL